MIKKLFVATNIVYNTKGGPQPKKNKPQKFFTPIIIHYGYEFPIKIATSIQQNVTTDTYYPLESILRIIQILICLAIAIPC